MTGGREKFRKEADRNTKGMRFLMTVFRTSSGRISLKDLLISPQAPPTPQVLNPPTYPHLCSWLLVRAPKYGSKNESNEHSAIRKTDQSLWAREKPQTWAVAPPYRKQKISSSQPDWVVRTRKDIQVQEFGCKREQEMWSKCIHAGLKTTNKTGLKPKPVWLSG